MNGGMRYAGQNWVVTRAIQRIEGAKLFTMRQLPAFRAELRAMDLSNKFLVVGILRAIKQLGRPVMTELELEAVMDQAEIRRMIEQSLFTTESDLGRKLNYGDLMKILGGSDVPDLVADMTDRERRKIDTSSQTREVKWIALLPSYLRLAEVVGSLSEHTSGEAVKIKEHRPVNHGGALDFVLNVNPYQLLDDNWKDFLDHMWPYLVHLGVPGVRETMLWFTVKNGHQFQGFSHMIFAEEWDEWRMKKYMGHFGETCPSCLKEDPDSNLKSFKEDCMKYLLEDWMSPPHCGIATLESAVGLQKTEVAKERLKIVIQELCRSRSFVVEEKTTEAALRKRFEDHNWPFVMLCRKWDSKAKKWFKRCTPERKYKEIMKDVNCVIVDATLYMDHFFLWEEDITYKWGLRDLRENGEMFKMFATKTSNKKLLKKGIKYIMPSVSSGRFLKRLIDNGVLIPMTVEERMKMGIHAPDPKTPADWIDWFMKYPEEVVENSWMDWDDQLKKKLHWGDDGELLTMMNRNRIFCGDTESFIDPDTGAHEPSLLVIKGYNEDSPIPRVVKSAWDSRDPICAGMREFLKAWAEKRTQELKDMLDRIEASEIDFFSNDQTKLKGCRTRWLTRHKEIDEIFEKYGTSYEGYRRIMKLNFVKNFPGRREFKDKWEPPIIYFHHLGYDVQPFLTRFVPDHRKQPIMKGAVYYSVSFKFIGEVFELRNSLTLITMGIAKFPKAFLPKEEQAKMIKEVYAYEAINKHLLDYRKKTRPGFWVTLDTLHDAIEAFEKKKNKEEQEKLYDDLVKTASRPEVNCIDGDLFDVGKYTIYYCERDVDLLKVGLHSWDAMGMQDTSKSTFKGVPPFGKFDVFNFLSAPAIAQALTEIKIRKYGNCFDPRLPQADNGFPCKLADRHAVYERQPEFRDYHTFKYTGRLRKFMLLATTGGRCTLANETCQKIDCLMNPDVKELYDKVVRGEKLTDEERQFMFDHTIQDFDARSLYPTAMSRSFIPLGIPEFFKCPPGTTEELLKKDPLPDDAYYVITKVKYDKELAIPCNCWKQVKPEPRCRWTNDVPQDVQLVRKQTDLLTMMEVQGAHFEIIGGCKWTHGKYEAIQEFMPQLYEFRRLNHSGGFDHPIQEVAKLLMNSFYGKNVTKVREFEEKMFPLNPWQKQKDGSFKRVNGFDLVQDFIKKNFRKIVGLRLLGGIISLKIRTEDTGKFDACFGCEVLAGSRALICRVSAAIEEITKNPPLYTDTDSLHVYGWQIGAISEWFQNKFGIPMIGGELGQFHPDFEPQGFKPGEKFLGSVFFCGVGKKVYIDEVFGDQGSTYFHKRAKGIRAEWLSKDEYKQLYEGEVLEKDCDACGGVNIRPKNGVNYSVHLIKKIRRTAFGEVEVEDEIRTLENKLVVQREDGDIEDPPSKDDRISTPPLGEAEMTQASFCTVSDDYLLANKRAREENLSESDEDTVIYEEPESDIDLAEHDESIEIMETPAPKKVADEVQKNVQRWLRDFDVRDKAMMYETLERFLAGGEMGEDDWFYLGRLNANNDDQVYAREAMRQLQQDLPQFQHFYDK